MLLSWSLAVSLAIVLVTIRLPVSGFTHHRIDNPELISDLDITEGSMEYVPTESGLFSNEAILGPDQAALTSNISAAAITINETGTTDSNLTEIHKDPIGANTSKSQTTSNKTTIAPINKSSAIHDNSMSTTMTDITLKQEMNTNESNRMILQNSSTTQHITTSVYEVTTATSLKYNEWQPSSSESLNDIVGAADTPKVYLLTSVPDFDLSKKSYEYSPITTKSDTEVFNTSDDKNVFQSISNESASDVTVTTVNSSTEIPTSSTKFLKVAMVDYQSSSENGNEPPSEKVNMEVQKTQDNNNNDAVFQSDLPASDFNATEISTEKPFFEVFDIFKSTIIPESSVSMKDSLGNTGTNPEHLSTKFYDKTVPQSISNELVPEVPVSASTVTGLLELSEVRTVDLDRSKKNNEISFTTQEPLSTIVDDKTVTLDLSTTVPALSVSTNESFKVTTIDSTTTEAHLEEKSTTAIEFVNTETLHADTMHMETTIDKTETSTLPFWKKYINIDRNPESIVSSEETTSSDLMTRGEAGRISLNKVLSNTPIPSLLELKKDLINIQDYTTKPSNTSNVTETNVNNTPDFKNISEKLESLPKLDIVFTKRAGYIDNTAITNSTPYKLTTAVSVNKGSVTEAEPYRQIYETESNEREIGDTPAIKKDTSLGSQSRLAEDAMKEELLMEKILHENEYIHVLDKRPAAVDDSQSTEVTDAVTEDLLSVKPINNKAALYSVNPNYKPLKRLDIQPTKQFVRDPDDNSWRNESISSLGIVFKPKNASKSFTEVLKNKTTELSITAEKDSKNDVPELRVRLEKIAEVRKSKKKKINMYGDAVYSDYEESSKDSPNLSSEEATSPMVPLAKPLSLNVDKVVENDVQKDNIKNFKDVSYDDLDDYDADYVTKIDLKKFTTQPPMAFMDIKQEPFTYMPDRQPTVQYFPPTKKAKTSYVNKVNTDEYEVFKDQFTYEEPTRPIYQMPFDTASPVPTDRSEDSRQKPTKSFPPAVYNFDKNLYFTDRPHVSYVRGSFVSDIENFNLNKPTYIIKHYKEAAESEKKELEDYKDSISSTEAPVHGITVGEIHKLSPTPKDFKQVEDYDYDAQFRRDIVHRFVDNFNQNSEKFRVDFPILYNNSVVHRTVADNGKVLASSSTFVKRLYETVSSKPTLLTNLKNCDANCETMKMVDLSPAYELHYYVPEQEEKEEIKPQINLLPHKYRL